MLVFERVAPAHELVSELPELDERAAIFCSPTDAAVVLGSTQPESDLDVVALERAEHRGVRRRSGGGAVLVAPGRQLWLDIFVPVGDPWFERDVTRAPAPIGAAWREALIVGGLPAGELVVHEGGLVEGPFSRQYCFLGLGPGELCFMGRKLLGLSQRRDRRGAWFFTMAPRVLDPVGDAALFALNEDDRAALAGLIAASVGALPIIEGLERRLVEALDAR